MSATKPYPDTFLSEAEFDALAQGRLSPEGLERLRAEVQSVLDDPNDSISHDEVWSRLERRMKRAIARAA